MLTIVPFGSARPPEPIAFIPFLDAIGRVANGFSSVPHEAVDIILNVVAFLPFGVIAALRWGRPPMTLAIVVAAALSTGIELAQAIEGLGGSPARPMSSRTRPAPPSGSSSGCGSATGGRPDRAPWPGPALAGTGGP